MPNFVMSGEGNNFLDMILAWENIQKTMKEEDNKFVRAKTLIDGQDFILFFTSRGAVYGASENARSIFSIMKNPMEEIGYEEMSFSAVNLTKAMQGEPKEEIFVYADIKEIKVIDKKIAYHMLMNNKHKGNDSEVHQKMKTLQTPNTIKTPDGRMRLHKDIK